MKGNPRIIEALNSLLADELSAINQYVVHAEMCANWGYERLHKYVEGRARAEMKHAEKLIARILFLEGAPVVNRLNDIRIGAEVPRQLESDLSSELLAVVHYNAAIKLADDVADAATRELLEDILAEEDRHANDIETQLVQIRQIGLPTYLGQQIAG